MGTSALGTVSDDDLLDLIGGGDKAAFAALYDRFSRPVQRLIEKSLVDVAQSEEVAQEVFLEVWRTAGRFDASRGRAATWVFTMARRRGIDRVRAAQSSRNRDWTVGIRDLEREFDSTYEAIEVKSEHSRIMRAMERITIKQREIVLLAYVDGKTPTRIASDLGIPLGTIKTRLRDGLSSLRRQLEVA